ncbi:hypothetical protein [Chryseobacterium ginsengisoli]
MTKKMISWLSILTVLLTLLWSCHNEDFAKGEAEPQRNNTNFFKYATSVTAKSGVDYVSILEAYNREKDFLSTMPDQKGMPVWDKMQVVDTETSTGLMIPLSDDNETMSSVLFATLDDENSIIGVKDYDNKLLENIVYSEKIDKDFREQMFYTFMYMDNKTFGNEDFTNIPKDLFVGKKYNNEYGRIRIKNLTTSTATAQQNGKMIWLQSCGVYWQCSHHGEGKCDNCMAKCHVNICYDLVISVPDGDASFPIPNTSGGGDGGGGAPGPQPPKDPCTLSGSTFYRISQQCIEHDDTGIDIDDPCEKTKNMLTRPNVQQGITDVKAQALQTLSNINTGEIGFKEKKDGTIAPADINSAHKVIYNDVTDAIGGYHNHTAQGTHMFSPQDIGDTLLGFAAAQNNVSDAYFGMIAAEWCNCPPSNKQFLHYVIQYTGAASDLGIGGNYNFTAAQMKQFENKYLIKVRELTNTSLNGNTYIKNNAGDLNEKGLEKLFFETLKNMNLNGKVNLQRIENGIVNNVTLDSNGIPIGTPCP